MVKMGLFGYKHGWFNISGSILGIGIHLIGTTRISLEMP